MRVVFKDRARRFAHFDAGLRRARFADSVRGNQIVLDAGPGMARQIRFPRRDYS